MIDFVGNGFHTIVAKVNDRIADVVGLSDQNNLKVTLGGDVPDDNSKIWIKYTTTINRINALIAEAVNDFDQHPFLWCIAMKSPTGSSLICEKGFDPIFFNHPDEFDSYMAQRLHALDGLESS